MCAADRRAGRALACAVNDPAASAAAVIINTVIMTTGSQRRPRKDRFGMRTSHGPGSWPMGREPPASGSVRPVFRQARAPSGSRACTPQVWLATWVTRMSTTVLARHSAVVLSVP